MATLEWLKTLPLAPEFYPSLAEFQDPISYIHKIEEEASQYGICKIIPPLPSPSKKTTAISNFNRALALSSTTTIQTSSNSNPKKSSPPTFTTQHQQIGGGASSASRPSVQNPVWQGGEAYTFNHFESKGKQFEKTQLKKSGKKEKGGFSPLEIEALFWKQQQADTEEPPLFVECSNAIPGSAFVPINCKKLREAGGDAATVGETAWNMRGVSRLKGSLLRFMEDEMPGVNSPMLYLSMLFTWSAWHREDHDLHSLNYLHMGASKTWYGVPGEAALAFEEAVRTHGYGGELNPLVTFTILNEKTTVMSPEILMSVGIPCCRLVQNAGEFVVTFPRAYHSGINHGFNCGETVNIATSEWLKVAKEAAVRRASINYPAMLSHSQLLYAFALSSSTRVSVGISTEPRSSRLKDKNRVEGETMVKKLFVQDVTEKNEILHVLLEKGSSCVLPPRNSSICSSFRSGSKMLKSKGSLRICNSEEDGDNLKASFVDDVTYDKKMHDGQWNGFLPEKRKSSVLSKGNTVQSFAISDQCLNINMSCSTSKTHGINSEKESTFRRGGIVDQVPFSCEICGLLSFPCVAVIQPREEAAQYMASTDCSFFSDWIAGPRIPDERDADVNGTASALNSYSGRIEQNDLELYDVPVLSGSLQTRVLNERVEAVSDAKAQKGSCSLSLLAAVYGNPSDSEEEESEPDMPVSADDNSGSAHGLVSCESDYACGNSKLHLDKPDHCDEESQRYHSSYSLAVQISKGASASYEKETVKGGSKRTMHCSLDRDREKVLSMKSKSTQSLEDTLLTYKRVKTGLDKTLQSKIKSERVESVGEEFPMMSTTTSTYDMSNCSPSSFTVKQKSDEDVSKKHIFCLEHAAEVEKRLRSIGGVHMLLLCHPDYPSIESEAELLAQELGFDYKWKDVQFEEASEEDLARIQSAMENEVAIPGKDDWTVKLGINLRYNASLSQSPHHYKQMPSLICRAFGCSSLISSAKPKVSREELGKRQKTVVAGRWCGKVWMSNQVHPYLVQKDSPEAETLGTFCFHAQSEPEVETKPDFSHLAKEPFIHKENSPQSGTTSVTRETGLKRKGTDTKVVNKKAKVSQLDDSAETAQDLPKRSSDLPCDRILRSQRVAAMLLKTQKYASNVKKENEIAGGISMCLRKRPLKPVGEEVKLVGKKQVKKNIKNRSLIRGSSRKIMKDEEGEYKCDVEGCDLEFSSKQELLLHKRNICLVEGCGKRLFSHKYLVQHGRVHMDARPLKCPWKGCKRTFKWTWARTEHIRVHTGDRPYVCNEPGCYQTFRFVSDFSRHKRKTGHSGERK